MCGNSIQECLNCQKPDCDNDHVKKAQQFNQEQVEHRRAWAKQRRDSWRQAGLCPSCGKRPPREGYKMCRQCQISFAAYRKEENRKKGIKPKSLLDGITLCKKCGKEAPLDGYKLCKRCYETSIANLRKTPTHKGIRQNDNFRKGVDAFWRSL